MSMKTLLNIYLTLLLLVLFSGCEASASDKAPVKKATKPNNYIIVLDLSDRLLAPHQTEQDIIVIKEVFDRFYHGVITKLIVNSKDRFSIRILPQQYPAIDIDRYNNELTLDMGLIHISGKKVALSEFNDRLINILKKLYEEAAAGKHTTNYAGVNIWRFFNEEINYLLDNNYNNHLIILTDGYLDFERNTQDQLNKHNRYTSTRFINKLKCDDWKEKAYKYDFGILPVTKPHPAASVLVCGINPKKNLLCETDKLMFFWGKWLREMNYDNYTLIKKLNGNQLSITLKKKQYI